ncbi:hypothetical protein BLNAU_15464 [Blattamonas nauphoetae]|uniref:SPRY domain-containing protein n=1 Tax=Blattamonas nauphoetae TaxID=2049346 RepID=A0ABQ9XDX0_9EUKA|nr:hypothetical protein BLNAU_15464 [Blattamonas nauphoetae]
MSTNLILLEKRTTPSTEPRRKLVIGSTATIDEREKALLEKEDRLLDRERELIDREKKLLIKEQELRDKEEEMNKALEEIKHTQSLQKTRNALDKLEQTNVLINIEEVQLSYINPNKWSRLGNAVTRVGGDGRRNCFLEPRLNEGIWRLSLYVIQRTGHFQLGIITDSPSKYPDGQYIGSVGNSVAFCPAFTRLYKSKENVTKSYGPNRVNFGTGCVVILEVDLRPPTTALRMYVDGVRLSIWCKNIPSDVQIAISLLNDGDGFEILSFQQLKTARHPLAQYDETVDWLS